MSETIAVYIDGDNASHRDMEAILNEIKSYGRIIISRVYGDWSKENMQKWLESASLYGIIPIQCGRISGKNSSDIKLCVDIMKDLYTVSKISLFYIITTDSDYRHVISEIKVQDKKIHCIGNNDANISLMSICDQYTKIDVIRKDNKDSPKNKPKTKKLKKSLFKKYKTEIDLLLEDNQKINISLLKDTLKRKYQFDYREWGYSKMSDFVIDNYGDIFNIVKSQKGDINIYNFST